MNLRQYLINSSRRVRIAEIQFEHKITKAAHLTMQPLIEAVRLDVRGSINSINTLIEGDEFEKVLRYYYVDWAYNYGRWFINKVGVQRKEIIHIDTWMQRLNEHFVTHGAEKVTLIVGTTKDLARKQITQAIRWADMGLSIDQIQGQIQQNITSSGGVMSSGRARTIARTEVIGASNVATHEAVAASGVKTEHKWITGGANIRDSHYAAEANGWIPFEERFDLGNGIHMMHPSETGAPAEEVINCKCKEIFRVVD